MGYLRNILFRKQTLDSFDYQWKNLSEGYGLLTDSYFKNNVCSILTNEELCIDKDWFNGRKILDAGCGNGRWTYGFLKLGAEVTAVDYSESALKMIADNFGEDFKNSLILRREDLLNMSEDLKRERFDLVFSWGVLHHTGDTFKALRNITSLVKDDGLVYLYLYGKESLPKFIEQVKLELKRLKLAFFPFEIKEKIIRKIARNDKEVHNLFDGLSPLINERFKFSTIEGWLKNLGFSDVIRTIRHTELFIRASRDNCSAREYFLPLPQEPYWFQKLGDR